MLHKYWNPEGGGGGGSRRTAIFFACVGSHLAFDHVFLSRQHTSPILNRVTQPSFSLPGCDVADAPYCSNRGHPQPFFSLLTKCGVDDAVDGLLRKERLQAKKQTNKQTNTKQTNNETDKQTNKQTDKQTDKQTTKKKKSKKEIKNK